MRHLLLIALDPSILSMLFLGLAIVWMLMDEKDRTRPLLVVAMVLNMFYGYLLNFVMGKENGLVPWKYDYVLARLDGALGISAATIASSLQGAARWPLEIVYLLMVPMMVVWFLVARRNRLTRPLTLAYITVLLLGLTLYAMLPACGPMYAFGKQWLHPPVVAPIAIRMAGNPNAFPSLHLATALIFVLLSAGPASRTFSLSFFIATALATISTGEHYVIDLVGGVAFGCLAVTIGQRRIKLALLWLALVLTWTLSIRWASEYWIDHPDLLRIFAAFTVTCVIGAVAFEWRHAPQAAPAPDQLSAGALVESAGAE